MKDIFKDDNGKTSFSRIFTAIIILFYLFWSGYIAYKTQAIPDIPSNLYMLVGVLYGSNKLASAVRAFK